MVMFFVGMRFLDFTNKWLQYAREVSFPFFWIHHPVTFFTAFYALQWETSLLVKMLVVGVGSLVISVGFVDILVRRIPPLRAFFGLKAIQQ